MKKIVLVLALATALALGLAAARPEAVLQGALDLVLAARGIRRVPFTDAGLTVPCYECGQGNPRTAVLLHGVGAEAASTWWRVMPALCGSHHVLAPQLPMADMAMVSLAHYTPLLDLRLVARLVEQRGGGRPADLAGLSVGAWLALRLAAQRPELVRSVVAAAPVGLDMPGLIRRFEAAGPSPGRWFYKSLFNHPPPLPEMVMAPHYARVDALARALPRLAKDIDPTGHGLAGTLSQVAQPVLLLWGAQDRILPPSDAREAQHWLRDARLEIIDDSGHAMVWDQPEAMARAMTRFFQETD